MKDELERALARELRSVLLDLEYIGNISLKQEMKVIIRSLASNYREIFLDALEEFEREIK